MNRRAEIHLFNFWKKPWFSIFLFINCENCGFNLMNFLEFDGSLYWLNHKIVTGLIWSNELIKWNKLNDFYLMPHFGWFASYQFQNTVFICCNLKLVKLQQQIYLSDQIPWLDKDFIIQISFCFFSCGYLPLDFLCMVFLMALVFIQFIIISVLYSFPILL